MFDLLRSILSLGVDEYFVLRHETEHCSFYRNANFANNFVLTKILEVLTKLDVRS